jgi:Asparagine synthase
VTLPASGVRPLAAPVPYVHDGAGTMFVLALDPAVVLAEDRRYDLAARSYAVLSDAATVCGGSGALIIDRSHRSCFMSAVPLKRRVVCAISTGAVTPCSWLRSFVAIRASSCCTFRWEWSRQIINTLLPPSLIARPKSGMRVPVQIWFQGELRRMAQDLLSPKAVKRAGVFDAKRVRDVMRYRTGRDGLRLWMLAGVPGTCVAPAFPLESLSMTRNWVGCTVGVVVTLVVVVGSATHTARAESAASHADSSPSNRVASFVPLTPARVLDTRSESKVGNAAGTAAALEVVVLGRGGLPSTGVAAVSLNVTVTDGENPTVGGGFVTVFPCGTRPDASNLNFDAGRTVPNAVIAPVSPTGKVCFYVYGTAHLLADVSGYFPTGSEFTSLTPARVLDTRATGKVGNAAGGGFPLELSVLGKGGLPASDVGAVALNVTVAEGETPTVGDGYLTVYPCGTRPDASNVNFVAGQTVPNLVIAPVSATGKVCFYVYGTAHLLADVSGFVSTGSDFVSQTPVRLLNTRHGSRIGNATGTGTILEVPVLGRAGLPGTSAGVPVIGALAVNVTVTDTEDPIVGGGYVTVFPCGTQPDASNLNFVAGQTIANSVIAPISATGTICFYVYGTAHLLVDVSGHFSTTNVVRFRIVGVDGLLLPNSGVLWCNLTLYPTCPGSNFAGMGADGVARLVLEPADSYRIQAHVGGTDWPCPWIGPTGQTSHFGTPLSGPSASFPGLSTLTILEPDPSMC